jgi:pseudouridine-5'-phosphate glycosidase
MKIKFNEEVAAALAENKPIVALESTVIAHGLPFPKNIETAFSLEKIVRASGAIPATIAVFGGEFCVGLSDGQIERLATDKNVRKISRRDLPVAVGKKLNCATTVATTAFTAHRGALPDVSADWPELATTPITVVCSGAKIVLDLPATREWLETNGVCVLGFACDELPAFYSRLSGLPIDERVENASEAARIIEGRDALRLPNAILLTVPVPREFEIERAELENILSDSLALAEAKQIRGKEITPFLLSEMSGRSAGKTLAANIALLENNARVAALVAAEISK